MDMQKDLFAKAEADFRDVEVQIASLMKRRAELAEFIALGRKLYGHPPAELAPKNGRAQAIVEQAKARVARADSLKATVLSVARQAAQSHDQITTARLVELLETQGVELTSKDKNTAVSVILSRSNEFVSDRRNGWSLAKKNPQDAATSTGSSTV